MKPSINRTLSIIGTTARTLLAITFLFSGFVKAIDPLGTTYKIEDYLKAFGGFFNSLLPLAPTAAWILIAAEFLIGFCLLLNIKTNITAYLALLFMIIMTPITLYLAITNPISDCGCFGDAVKLTNWQTFYKNIILLLLVIILLLTKKYSYPFLKPTTQLILLAAATTFIFIWMIITITNLPLIDFRPYKIGNNIPQLMQYPDDAEPDQYQTLLIYEKNGQQQTFTLQDYPRGDSTWHFIDQQTKLIKKGYEPPIHDFEIINLDGDDLTDDILQMPSVNLIIMYDLNKTSQTKKTIKNLQNIISAAQQDSQPLFILTGSNEDDIYNFCNQHTFLTTELFCLSDPVTLKTIVRANPGLVTLTNGTITNKKNL